MGTASLEAPGLIPRSNIQKSWQNDKKCAMVSVERQETFKLQGLIV